MDIAGYNQADRMMEQPKKKSPYETPVLTEFGSVRNLTGGSGTTDMDGSSAMTNDGLGMNFMM